MDGTENGGPRISRTYARLSRRGSGSRGSGISVTTRRKPRRRRLTNRSCRSAGSIRPGLLPRSSSDCRSRRSISRRRASGRSEDLCTRGPRRRPSFARASRSGRRKVSRRCRPQTRARRSGSRPRVSRSRSASGPTMFERHGKDRFGLASARPAALVDLPAFAHEQLDPRRTGGDIVVQACADDPQVTFHAIRNLARIGRDTAAIRWTQLGFGQTSSTGAVHETPGTSRGSRTAPTT